jgi:pimeloyl-ACP methyl ester carboxylesterase
MSTTKNYKTMQLPDGRTLGYAELGEPEGVPIFYFHGLPGSRLEAQKINRCVNKINARLIGVDRPGMGVSDFQPKRQLLDWPVDVSALADSLAIDRFCVLRLSGGGPHALACACKIPERITACGVVSSIGPPEINNEGMGKANRYFLSPSKYITPLTRFMLWMLVERYSQDERKLEHYFMRLSKKVPEPEKKILEDPDLMKPAIEATKDSFRQGCKGMANEMTLYSSPWGFQLEDISIENMYLWHGELDENIPVSMGKAMAESIPKCQETYFPQESHLSTIVNHIDEILTATTIS